MSTFAFPEIQTPRVHLRLLDLEDAAEILEHFADERVTRYMDIDALRTLDEAREVIAFHVNDSGCRWGLFGSTSGKLIGTCGYHRWRVDAPATAELGFDLGHAHWGRGIMQEVLPPVLAFGFDGMRLARIEATAEPENRRSIRLLERLGFERETALRDGLLVFHRDSV